MINRILDRFIPVAFEAPESLEKSLYLIKWRIWIMGSWIASLAIMTIFTLRIYAEGFQDPSAFFFPLLVAFIGIIFPNLALITGRFRRFAAAELLLGSLLLHYRFLVIGGIESELAYALPIIPCISIFVLGVRRGLILASFDIGLTLFCFFNESILPTTSIVNTPWTRTIYAIAYASLLWLGTRQLENMRVNTMRSLSEAKQKLLEQQEINAKLESEKITSALMVSLHHEINNPLAIASASASILKRKNLSDGTGDQDKTLELIDRELQQISRALIQVSPYRSKNQGSS